MKISGQKDKIQDRAEQCNCASIYTFECQTPILMLACQAVNRNAKSHSGTWQQILKTSDVPQYFWLCRFVSEKFQ